MGWSKERKICRLLEFIQDSNEFYIIKRLYGVLFLQIFVVTFYPDAILKGDSFGSLGERFFKGAILFILAWRAMGFQLREMWIIPEGKLGRLYSVLLPSLFIITVYFAYDLETANLWIFGVAFTLTLYGLKPAVLRFFIPRRGTYFLDIVSSDDPSILKIPLWTWMRNILFLALVFLVIGVISWLLETDDRQCIIKWSEFNLPLLGKVFTRDVSLTIILTWIMWFYSRTSQSHHYEDYLDKLEISLKDDITINPWLIRDSKKKSE